MTTRQTRLVSLLFLLMLIFAVTAEAATTTITQNNTSGTLRMTLRGHAHELSNFSAYGATITATCANSDGLCKLPDKKAALIILAPAAGGGAAVLSGDVRSFGVSSADIKYAQRTGSDWGTETSTVPSAKGFFKASITAGGVTASVTYGINAITVASGIEHGSITAPYVAAVNAVVPLTITPDNGYELDTLTPTKKAGGATIQTTTDANGNQSFVMPDEEVIVIATFKLKGTQSPST